MKPGCSATRNYDGCRVALITLDPDGYMTIERKHPPIQ